MSEDQTAFTPPAEEPASLSRNTLVMAIGTVLSRATGFGRVLALAYVLGFNRLADTYNLANTTPNIIYELVLGGILSATLVPVFVGRLAAAANERDDADAWRGISALTTVTAAALVALSLLFAIAAPLIIRLYTVANPSPDVDVQRDVATTLLVFFAVQIALYGVITVTTALLQVRRRFAAPMFAPVLNNLIVIATFVCVPLIADDRSLTGARDNTGLLLLLGLGTSAGVAAQAIVQWVAMRRAGVRLRPVWAPRHETVRRVVRLSGWTLGFVVANQVALYVVLVLANRRPGGVSTYQAAQLFFLLPHAIFTVSIISALLPDLAELWSTGQVARYRERLAAGSRLTLVVLVPAAVGLAVLARPLVDLVLDHGAFRASSARLTADTLALFAIGLPGFSAFLLLTRAYQAMEDTRSVFYLYVFENAVNVVLAFALFPSLGVRGLALAYGIAYLVAAVVAFLRLRRRTDGLEGGRALRSLGRVTAASVVMAAVVLAVSHGIGGDDGARLVARVVLGTAAGLLTYLAATRLLRVEEVGMLFRFRRRAA